MIQACHYTEEESYHKIKKDGFLKSVENRLNSSEEIKHNLLPEWILGDREYVFFSVLNSDMDFAGTRGYGSFGLIFDAEQLIKEFEGLASIDLQSQYGDLQEAVAKEVYARHNPAAPPGDEGFYSIFFSLLDRYEENDATIEAIELLDERSATLRSENRVAGDDALALIQQNPETDLEILVKVDVPVEIAIAEFINGEYVMRT